MILVDRFIRSIHKKNKRAKFGVITVEVGCSSFAYLVVVRWVNGAVIGQSENLAVHRRVQSFARSAL